MTSKADRYSDGVSWQRKIRFGLGERIDRNDPRLELLVYILDTILTALGLERAPRNPDVM